MDLVFRLAFYFLWSVENLAPAFLTLVVGAVGAITLSYPILITLERPVRVTPEQALRDYYAALSHHLPHFRRMWLLLSTAGRISNAYGSFEGFKAYWTDRLRNPPRRTRWPVDVPWSLKSSISSRKRVAARA